MAIPNKEQAQYNSLQEFIGFFKAEPNAPSYSNLFSVHFSTPPMLQNGAYGMNTTKYEPQREILRTLLNYYAESVNLPSKQVTTGTYNQLGSAIRYATGSTFSQISITFRVPRSGETRAFFEKWISMMANDASQYTDYYNNYVCNTLRIYKWERGGGDVAVSKPQFRKAVRDSGLDASQISAPRLNSLSTAYELRNVFPYNIGSIQLDNAQAKTVSMTVQFYYERYRFYQADDLTFPQTIDPTQVRLDNLTQPGTDPLVNFQFGQLFNRYKNLVNQDFGIF